MNPRIHWYEWAVLAAASGLLIWFASMDWLKGDEVFGFLTGGACVWLVVRQHILNWPVGLVNNIVFFVLFLNARLYADMGLQVVFFVLGAYGWWNWARRGPDTRPLKPKCAGGAELFAVIVAVALATFALREILLWANGAAPVFDALTTALSLGAQYLLTRKRIENWYLWIIADAIYVPLYFSRELPLTAVLYAVFLVMCIIGLFAWRRSMREPAA